MRFDYVFNDENAGGETWAKKHATKIQLKRFRDNLQHRYFYHEPDFVLISGRYAALEFLRALRWSKRLHGTSTLKELYRTTYKDTKTRTIETFGRSIKCRLCTDLSWWGEDKIRTKNLPYEVWGKLFYDLGCYLSGDHNHVEVRAEKAAERKLMGGEVYLEGLTNEFLGGRPIVRLPEDRKNENRIGK